MLTEQEIINLEASRYGYEDGSKTALFLIAAQLADLTQTMRDIQQELILIRRSQPCA